MRFSLLVLLSISQPSAAFAFESVATLAGTAKVKDGDGILFGSIEIRLQGIAAPEDNNSLTEPGGKESTANLRHLVEGKQIRCELDGTLAPPKRPVGICFLGQIDIGEHQVLTGNARDCAHFSGGRYKAAETAARSSGNDLSKIYAIPEYCQ
jgi:endonuclease YncB( thermonuclease family)